MLRASFLAAWIRPFLRNQVFMPGSSKHVSSQSLFFCRLFLVRLPSLTKMRIIHDLHLQLKPAKRNLALILEP